MKRDHITLEKQATGLLEKGLSELEVPRRVGVRRQSVHRWATELAAKARPAPKRASRPGRRRHLTPADLRRIARLLKRRPEALGFCTRAWTAADRIVPSCGATCSTALACACSAHRAGQPSGPPGGQSTGTTPPSGGESANGGPRQQDTGVKGQTMSVSTSEPR